MTSRRDWLKTAIAIGGSVPLGAFAAQDIFAAPVSRAEANFTAAGNGKMVRLGSNENPYGPSAKAKDAIIKMLSEGNRYAFEQMNEFKKILAKKENVTPEHILLGNGSSELLCLAGISAGLEGGRIASPFPTFRSLMEYAGKFNAAWDKVDVNDSLGVDLNALRQAVRPDTRLVFLVNPNNPTGTLLDGDDYRNFCNEISDKTTVFADEAYLEFLEPAQQVSMVELVRKDKNVIVSRTFSKIFGLAGLRLGYAIAHPDRIKNMEKYQMGAALNINQCVLAAAKASLEDEAFMKLSREKNAAARKVMTDYLDSKKIPYGMSYTNFLFFPAPMDGKTILERTSAKGYQIRVWDYNGREYCRVSIGTLDEMKSFVRTFDEIVA